MKKRGLVIGSTKHLESHELATVLFLKGQGCRLQLIPISTVPGEKTPDFVMNGQEWEMKSPKSGKRKTLEHAFYAGVKQSENLVFDLRKIKAGQSSDNAIRTLLTIFHGSRRARRLLIITKDNRLHTFEK